MTAHSALQGMMAFLETLKPIVCHSMRAIPLSPSVNRGSSHDGDEIGHMRSRVVPAHDCGEAAVRTVTVKWACLEAVETVEKDLVKPQS
jgi:hypothetical protein